MHNLCKLIKLITQISQGFGLFFFWSINPPSLFFSPPNSVCWCGQLTLVLVVVADGLETLSGFLFGLWAWPRRVLKEQMDEQGWVS